MDVFKNSNDATIIGVDRDAGTVFVDRRHSGNVNFNPKFPGVYSTALRFPGGPVKLDVLVDACSVEVFVNDGEKVFTVLAFHSAESHGVEFFGAGNGAMIHSLKVWKIRSIWR